MRELIKLELKKFFLQRNNWILFGVIVILLGVFIYPNILSDRHQWSYLPYSLKMQLEQSIDNVPLWEQTLSELPENKAVVANLKDEKNSVEHFTTMLQGLEEENWDLYLEGRLKEDKQSLVGVKEGRLVGPLVSDLQQEIELSELLLASHIKPIFTEYSMQSINFLILLLQHKMIVVFLFIVVFMSSHFISSDFEKETYKLLYTQPISKLKILMSKLLSALMINMGWMVVLIGGFSLILGMIYGFGDINYPTKLYVGGEIIYSTAGHYLGIGLAMLVCLVLLCVVMTFIFSTLFHHTLIALITSALLLFLPFIGMKNELFINIASYFPFSYEEVGAILSGKSLFETIGYEFAIVFLPLSSIVMFGVLLIVFKFRKLA